MIKCLDCGKPIYSIQYQDGGGIVAGWQRVWYEKIDSHTQKKMIGYVCEECHKDMETISSIGPYYSHENYI